MAKKLISPWLDSYQTPDTNVIIDSYRFAGGGGGGTPALIANTGLNLGSNGGTTVPINTTGANIIFVGIVYYNPSGAGSALTDSAGNSWTPLTGWIDQVRCTIWYCYNPTTSLLHTFSYGSSTNYPSITVSAFSNIASSPFDVESGNTGAASSLSTGTITPSQANTLVITVLGNENNGGALWTINNGFTITDAIPYIGGGGEGCTMAYKVLTSAAATNATWTSSSSTNAASGIASFKY